MEAESSKLEPGAADGQSWLQPIHRHRIAVILLYAATAFTAIAVLALPDTRINTVTVLSTGAILATFGSAIATLGSIWERDLLERIRLNIDILYKDIIRQEQPWRRWPFLPRAAKRKLLDGSMHVATLTNPDIPLDVGTHVIRISLPTVLEDFFDLSVRANFVKLDRFRSAAGTTFSNRGDEEANAATGMSRGDQLMAYECLHDIWRSILVFRLARYFTHLGAGFTISAALVTALHIVGIRCT